MRKLLFYIGLLVFSTSALSNTELQGERKSGAYPWAVKLEWANDFVFQTDYYFTNGLSLEVWNNRFQSFPLNFILTPNLEDSHVYYGMSLTQDIFTPVNTRANIPQTGDRPYASYWLAGSVKQSYNFDYSFGLTSGLYFGMSGYAGGGEWVQNGIHDLLPTSGHVSGWNHQLESSFLLDYHLNVEKQFYRNQYFRLSGSAAGMLGTPFTNLQSGVQLYYGKFGRYPGILFLDERREFHIYGFSKVNAKWVIHDGTMQGGLFEANKSPLSITPNQLVLQFQNGISAKFRSFTVELGHKFLTPEFSGARAHNWGYLGISVAF